MTNNVMEKAVILARGLGTRMRKEDESAEMSEQQSEVANTGLKAMIPIDRPFLDYVLHDLADAGYKKVCLVIGPEHDNVREYYREKVQCSRLQIDFAVQTEPLGTADAVAAAEDFAAGDPILVINSDNYYPMEALRGLRKLQSNNGLAAFDRDAMLADSNIPADRITRFAVIHLDDNGFMTRIIEKPDEDTMNSLPEPICVSMNCWRFGPEIFTGCRSIKPSPRGELEITDAVQYCIDTLGCKFEAPIYKAPVLDMSFRSDVPSITEKLKGKKVYL